MDRLRRFGALVWFVLRSPALIVVTLVLAALWFWPLSLHHFYPVPGDPELAATLESVIGQAAYTAGMDDAQIAYTKRRAEAAQAVIDAPDEASAVRAYATYERIECLEGGKVRMLSTEPEVQRKARVALWEAVAALPDASAAAWGSMEEYPALLYLSAAAALLPSWAWVLPALAAVWSAGRLAAGRRGLLRVRPVSAASGFLATVGAAALAASIAALASVVPAFLVSALRNGVGDGAYPVVNIVGSSVVSGTVASSLGSVAAAWALASLFVCSAGLCVTAMCDSRLLGAFVAAVVAVAPGFLTDASAASHGQVAGPDLWAPTTYLRPPAYCGRFTYSSILDHTTTNAFGETVSLLPKPIEGASLPVASIVFALWSAATCAVGALACVARLPRPDRRACRKEASS